MVSTDRPFSILAALVLGLMVLSLALGPNGIGLPASAEARWLVLSEIRMPRTGLAVLVGAALAVSGATLQAYLRNPLAEPGLLGITGGAALGAVIAIHSGVAGAIALVLPIAGLVGAGVATVLVVALAARAQAGTLGLVLAGVAISSLAGALTTLALNLAPNPFAATEIIIWLLGSLTDRSLLHLGLAGPLIFAGLVILWRTAGDLDALALGEEVAENLGVEPAKLVRRIVAGAALAVGAATSVAGGISFVGLVVPHLLRGWVGTRATRLLPASALGGAALVLAGDIAVRLVAPYADIKLGVLTALVGAPFFLWLIGSSAREVAR